MGLKEIRQVYINWSLKYSIWWVMSRINTIYGIIFVRPAALTKKKSRVISDPAYIGRPMRMCHLLKNI